MTHAPSPAAPVATAAAQFRPDWWVRALTRREIGRITHKPAWAALAEQTAEAAAPPGVMPAMDSWPEAFAVPFRPFLTWVRDHLTQGARQCLPAGYGEPGLIADTFTAAAGRKLAPLAARTLELELERSRASGCLAGRDGRQRFADFLRRQCAPAALAALFGEYPVLARLLGTASLQAAESGLEILARFAADRAAVVQDLLDGADPGPIVAVEPGLGDQHRRGRSVAAVSFADGRKVIYKPRDIGTYELFRQVAGWLGQRAPRCDLRTARALPRPGYGWLEFIECRPLHRPDEVEDFYRRTGLLLAVLYVLQAVDIHCENVIACGDQPVLIDAETLFHPALPPALVTAADPAAEALAASVYRTGFLPRPDVGEDGVLDRSGMGGDQGQRCPRPVLEWDPPGTDETRLIWRPAAFAGAGNRPHLDGKPMEPADHAAAVLAGFRLGYDTIAADRQSFGRLIEAHQDVETRIVIRSTHGYSRLLDESTVPGLLRSARDRERVFGVLHQAPGHHRLWRRLARHEVADLWAGDIPLLTGLPAARDVWTSDGQRVPGQLGRTGLSRTMKTLEALGPADRRDQEWFILASLATRRLGGHHRSTQPMPDPVTMTAVQPGRLLAAACGLADQIIARGKAVADQSRVNWAGLQLVEDSHWMLLPMGASLADGYLGVALFLAQLTALTRISRYAEEARRAVSQIPRLCEGLAGRPDLLAAVGCGGMQGLGGVSYGLARMAALLDDSALREWAHTAVAVTARAAEESGIPWWAAGTAGCLAAMSATAAELGSTAAAALAATCAGRLAGLVERTDGRCVPPGEPVPPGFAAGAAGVGWALVQFAAAGAAPRYRQAGQRALRCSGGLTATAGQNGLNGWCSGTAGLLIAGSCLDGDGGLPGVQWTAPGLVNRPVLRDLSLCHGELGITEALIVLAAAGHDQAASQALRHRAGLILAAIGRHTWHCGTPSGISTPGLLSGLAGIGYGLLRLGFPEQVPSVLLLEPAARITGLPSARPASTENQPCQQ